VKFTLDWNCVIEVEEDQPQAVSVRALVDAHRSKRIEVALLATSASENTKSRVFPCSAELFLQRVARQGWQDLPLVPMPAISDLSFWDHAYYVDDDEEFDRMYDALWAVMASNIASDPEKHLCEGQTFNDDAIHSEALAKWRNAWCDVMSAYTHIHERRDVFVTNNTKDFQDKREALAVLGMRCIATPAEAVLLLPAP